MGRREFFFVLRFCLTLSTLSLTHFFFFSHLHFNPQIRPPTSPCRCPFPSECDSQGGGAPPTRAALAAAAAAAAREAAAGEFAAAAASAVSSASAAFVAAAAAGAAGAAVLERSLVSEVYDRIAPHFDSTRFAVWPQVASFVKKCCGDEVDEVDDVDDVDAEKKKKPSNSSSSTPKTNRHNRPRLLLDVGCGNGKYLHLAPPGTAFLACEPCEGLARAAADAAKGEEWSGFGAGAASRARAQAVCVARADGIAMPYRKGVFDGVICIAVSVGRREEEEMIFRTFFFNFFNSLFFPFKLFNSFPHPHHYR